MSGHWRLIPRLSSTITAIPSFASPRPALGIAAVFIGAFISALNTRLTTFGVADIRGGLGLSFDDAAWLTTLLAAPQLLLAPPTAYLARAIGARRILVPSCIVFAAGSLALPLLSNTEAVLAMQTIRGFAIATLLPATLSFVLQALPPNALIWGLAAYGFNNIFASNIAASIEGFYADGGDWRWILWQNVPLSLAMLALVRLGMALPPLQRAALRGIDWGGPLLLGGGLALIYAGLDQGNRLDWLNSGTVLGLLCGGAVLILAFVARTMIVRESWLQAALLRRRNILIAGLVLALYATATMPSLIVVPNYLQTVRGLRAVQVGDVLLWVALPQLILMPAVVWLLRRVDPRLTLGAGLLLLGISAWLQTGLTHDWVAENFLPAAILQAIGQSLGITSVLVFVVGNVAEPAEAATISAWLQICRLSGSEVGAAAVTTLLRVREQLASNFIGLGVTSGAIQVQDALLSLGERFNPTGISAASRSVATLASLVRGEASVIACIDVFWLIAWTTVAALVLVALARRPLRRL